MTVLTARRSVCAAILALATLLALPARASDEVQVIVNESVSVPAAFTAGVLRSVFFGRMHAWPDGTPVKVFVLPEAHPLHKKFCIGYLKTFPYVLRKQWDQLTFTGTGVAPIEVATTYQLYNKVRTTPGAIGYSNRLPGNESPIKVVGANTLPTDQTLRF